jgi:NTE family protein
MNATPSSAVPSAAESARSQQDRPLIDAARRPDAARGRALVLGGGGSAGNAWLIGVLAGLVDGGVDVTQADLAVGTSAGSTAAAQIAGASPSRLLADILSAAPQQQPRPAEAPGGRGPMPVVNHVERTGRIIAAADDVADMRRRLGASALELDAASGDSWSRRWRATVATRLPSRHWPQRPLRITAVDARTGEPVVFDRRSGVDLVDAVAASTSIGLPYRIGEDRYIDGAYRRNENADLAAGHERVLALSPLGGRTRMPLDWGMQLAARVDELRAGGRRVESVLPDSASLAAFGNNLMDLSTRAPAARAGYDQGGRLARAAHCVLELMPTEPCRARTG